MKKMFFIIGPPGAGKGAQGKRLSQHLEIPNISSGDLIRNNLNPYSYYRNLIDNAKFIPNTAVNFLIEKRLQEADTAKGFILDGFPRNLAQLKNFLSHRAPPSFFGSPGENPYQVIAIHIPDEEAIKRIKGRLIHLPSGRTYHDLYHPPKVENRDDVTGELLSQRSDDSVEKIRARLVDYKNLTLPVLDFIATHSGKRFCLHLIDGVGTEDQVFARILEALENKKDAQQTSQWKKFLPKNPFTPSII